MDYTIFKRLATQYVEENHGGLSVLSTYNKLVQDKVHIHMLKLMLAECGQDAKEIQKTIKECAAYEKRFFKECLN